MSSEERRDGYVMVLKDWLGFFPPVGQEFSLERDGRTEPARIDAEPCTCRGPEKPHEHYSLRVPNLGDATQVTVSKLAGGSYALQVDR
ncbi:MAG: hypothetical protein C0506_12965 [Anaerolinea sp.]|nr:hypothetical protein [Anaerolinea sp.]